jgi:hypothetical protein
MLFVVTAWRYGDISIGLGCACNTAYVNMKTMKRMRDLALLKGIVLRVLDCGDISEIDLCAGNTA